MNKKRHCLKLGLDEVHVQGPLTGAGVRSQALGVLNAGAVWVTISPEHREGTRHLQEMLQQKFLLRKPAFRFQFHHLRLPNPDRVATNYCCLNLHLIPFFLVVLFFPFGNYSHFIFKTYSRNLWIQVWACVLGEAHQNLSPAW